MGNRDREVKSTECYLEINRTHINDITPGQRGTTARLGGRGLASTSTKWRVGTFCLEHGVWEMKRERWGVEYVRNIEGAFKYSNTGVRRGRARGLGPTK